MLPLTQRVGRHFCPPLSTLHCLHHHRCRHLTLSAATTTESENNADPGDTFGRLAEDTSRGSVTRESSNRKEFSKHFRGFKEPLRGPRGFSKLSPSLKAPEESTRPSGSQNSPRDFRAPTVGSPGLPQDSTPLEIWSHFKDEEYKEILAKWNNTQQDDAEDDYHHFLKHGATGRAQTNREEKASYETARGGRKERGVARGGNTRISDERKASQMPSGREDIFGRLSPQEENEEEAEGDEGDMREERYQEAKLERRHRPHYYGFMMKRLCKEGKLREAIRVLDEVMPAAGTKPDDFCYQVLINACGRAGYTKKAFKLYNQMKKRGLKVEPVAYTGLFNACAHSPWPTTDGLQRARHLRALLQEKGIHVNQIVSHSMIKAFGRCGDMETAFLVVDEMVNEGLLVTTETMSFLLQACITDREAGFRHAVMVWRKMRELNLKPDIYSYNLLVRITKDCGAGEPRLTSALLGEGHNTSSPSHKSSGKSKLKLVTSEALEVTGQEVPSPQESPKGTPEDGGIASRGVNEIVEMGLTEVDGEGKEVTLPNILDKRVTLGAVVGLGPLDKPQDRLALLGGSTGILKQMVKDRVTPNLKTLTQLLDALPPDTPSEEALLESMKNANLEPDTQFFNMLIRRRNFRYDAAGAKDVLILMQNYHLMPDLITYGCLALGCRDTNSATQLLRDMDTANFRPNLEILTILTRNSLVKHDYHYTLAMLEEMQQRSIAPNEFLLTHLEQGRARARNKLLQKCEGNQERRKTMRVEEVFLARYKTWLKASQVQLPEHPWTQYRQGHGPGVSDHF